MFQNIQAVAELPIKPTLIRSEYTRRGEQVHALLRCARSKMSFQMLLFLGIIVQNPLKLTQMTKLSIDQYFLIEAILMDAFAEVNKTLASSRITRRLIK